jgi:LysM repeat protein
MPIDGMPPITPRYDDPSSGSSGTPNSSAPSGQPAASAGHDTKVFGNLQGRDPDLIFAGEKIMINGKEVTVADGDTLSSLAAKHGTTVDALIKDNKMDASLLGKNAQGQYFTPGGPQPANGGATTPPPNATTNAAPAGNTTAPNNTPAPGSTNSGGNPPVRQANLSSKDSYGLEGGPINQDRLFYLRQQPSTPPKGTELTAEQLTRVQEILSGLADGTIKDGGAGLSQQDKNILNLWMKENRVAVAVPGTGTGSLSANVA